MMSGFASKLQLSTIFNRSAYAGPRRFVIMGSGVAVVAAAVVYVSLSGSAAPLTTRLTRLPAVNPLPGGLQSNPEQDKLALETNQEQADQAAKRGLSYTPPIAASPPLTAIAVMRSSPIRGGSTPRAPAGC
jgi:intracellular multiplication protein IcmE